MLQTDFNALSFSASILTLVPLYLQGLSHSLLRLLTEIDPKTPLVIPVL